MIKKTLTKTEVITNQVNALEFSREDYARILNGIAVISEFENLFEDCGRNNYVVMNSETGEVITHEDIETAVRTLSFMFYVNLYEAK